MTCSNEDRGRNRRPGAEDRGWSHKSGTRWSGDREVGWRCVRSAPCTLRRGAQVSWLCLKTKVNDLSVVWPQNHWNGFLQFDLKIGGDGFLVELQNQGGGGFFGLDLKTGIYGLVILGLKIITTVSWFEHQNQTCFDLSVVPQNRWGEVGVGHVSRSNSLLHVEASLVRVFQSDLKTDGDATTGGARGTITEVTLELS
jgi:hypothetical protein